jgi:hypothetical protein
MPQFVGSLLTVGMQPLKLHLSQSHFIKLPCDKAMADSEACKYPIQAVTGRGSTQTTRHIATAQPEVCNHLWPLLLRHPSVAPSSLGCCAAGMLPVLPRPRQASAPSNGSGT